MADLLLDVINYLKLAGLVSGDGIDCFRDFSPPAPDSAVILNEYGGNPSEASEAAVRSVQVVVRDVNAATAKSKSWQLFGALDRPEDRIIQLTAQRWCIILARQTPFKIGTDENSRVLWGFNLAMTTTRD